MKGHTARKVLRGFNSIQIQIFFGALSKQLTCAKKNSSSMASFYLLCHSILISTRWLFRLVGPQLVTMCRVSSHNTELATLRAGYPPQKTFTKQRGCLHRSSWRVLPASLAALYDEGQPRHHGQG